MHECRVTIVERKDDLWLSRRSNKTKGQKNIDSLEVWAVQRKSVRNEEGGQNAKSCVH
jgi:hypothetical protein